MFGTEQERVDQPTTFVLDAKRQIFHYMIFGHERLNAPGSSGYAEIGGNDALVTLASFESGVGNTDQQAGTIMHELGHNLNLLHGGPNPVDAAEIAFMSENCKPNYLSVMSYSRQFEENTKDRVLDYSQKQLADLDENDLDESLGVELYTPDPNEIILCAPMVDSLAV